MRTRAKGVSFRVVFGKVMLGFDHVYAGRGVGQAWAVVLVLVCGGYFFPYVGGVSWGRGWAVVDVI